MRSISSPGVWVLWKPMSSARPCVARSRRNLLVDVQAMFSLMYVATTDSACWDSATPINSSAVASRGAVWAPDLAVWMQ